MLDGSKMHLYADVMDIYWIHNPMDIEKWTPKLIPLTKIGQIKTIGVSNHNLSEIKWVNEILVTTKKSLQYKITSVCYIVLRRGLASSIIAKKTVLFSLLT